MYGVCIPCDTRVALEFDEENGNDNWIKAIKTQNPMITIHFMIKA